MLAQILNWSCHHLSLSDDELIAINLLVKLLYTKTWLPEILAFDASETVLQSSLHGLIVYYHLCSIFT